MRIFAATKNLGKLRELQAIFGGLGYRVEAYVEYLDPEEVEVTYAGNAALKARALAAQLTAVGLHGAALGDDSGFEIIALGGRPGVRSARYGSPGATWAERRAALLAEFAASGALERDARFVCALHVAIAGGGDEFAAFGTVEGRLAAHERGEGGFSYDAIFELPPLYRTFAELSEQEKNALSHRAQAARALLAATAGRGAALGSVLAERE